MRHQCPLYVRGKRAARLARELAARKGATADGARMSGVIRFVGDVHGRFGQYEKIIAGAPRSVQVGDMGIGFRPAGGPPDGAFSVTPPHGAMARGDHRYIRGNNDNPAVCREDPHWIPDGRFENGIMFVGGALSIDRPLRTEGYSWWPDEELSPAELRRMLALYIERKPAIMVTHDCPEEVARIVITRIPAMGVSRKDFPSRTRYALQEMWAAHAPSLWIFGHYHLGFDQILRGGRENGTRFVCLAELEYRDVNVARAA
jgi:hypothetical protein